jgi:hypothetical protein
MPSSNDALSGLIKWLRREPWGDAFGELLERHLGPACDKAGVPLDELGDVIGEHWAMTLWGCAFEDFLTREVEGAGNCQATPGSDPLATRRTDPLGGVGVAGGLSR